MLLPQATNRNSPNDRNISAARLTIMSSRRWLACSLMATAGARNSLG